MQRRDFLKAGAAVGVGACAPAGSAPAVTPAARTPVDMTAFLAELDRGMEAIARGRPLGRFQPGYVGRGQRPSRRHRASMSQRDVLARKAVRALFLAGAIQELPEPERAHPGVRARLEKYSVEVDQAIFGTKQMLASLTSADRQRLRSTLRRDPHLPMRMSETLDVQAASLRIPHPRRLKLRTIVTNASWRLRHQAPSVLIDDCVAKVNKIARRHGYDQELQRRLATQAAEASFWSFADQAIGPTKSSAAAVGATVFGAEDWTPIVAGGHLAQPAASTSAAFPDVPPEPAPVPAPASSASAPAMPTPAPAPASPAAGSSGGFGEWTPVEPEPEPPPETKKEHPGSGTVSAGLWMMGIGLGVIVIGAAVASGEATIGAGVVLATIGALLLVIGLITLIVGGIIYAASDDPNKQTAPDEPEPGDGWQPQQPTGPPSR